MENVLVNCPRMQLLLFLWPWYASHEYETAKIPHIYDVRFVIGICADYRKIGKLAQRAYRITGRSPKTL
jgi:hypothetical protein